MIRVSLTASAVLLATQSAFAGGIERTTQSVAPIFEPGNYLEFSFASVAPKVSGIGGGTVPNPVQPTPGQASGDMAADYWTVGTAFKMPINDKIDAALIIDQPFGADTSYPVATTYFARGSVAVLDTTAYTGIVKYRFSDRISAYAGLRAQTMVANARVPFIPGGYAVTGAKDMGIGYLVGAAYERPDIALRVALTYNSSVKHELATSETSGLGTNASTTAIDTPQSVNLEFQTGIAKDTLLFGGVRWVEWSKFDITPTDYQTLTGSSLVSYDNDVFTYSLGLGRRLNETWSVAGSVTHEKSNGGFVSNLSPTDGKTSVGLGVTYTHEGMKVTAGVSHTWIGDANTQIGGSGLPAGVFADNTALAFGMKVGFHF